MGSKAAFSYAPLEIDQVRWYWNKQPYSLKAVHQLDVQSRSQLTRYCEEDSNALEQEYRARAEELEKAWWSEEAELSSGPAAAAGKNSLPEDETASTKWQDYVLGDRREEVGLQVKAGLHEVDMVKRRMQPCYWPGSTHRVIRGSWFVDKGSGYAPLKETVADELEEAYRSHVWDPSLRHIQKQKQGVTAARVELTSLFTKGQYALFVSSDEAFLCTDTTFGSWFSRKGMPGQKLRRGYLPPKPSDKQLEIDIKQEEVENYCGRVPVNRLVLACHGIGQKLAVSNIAHDAACMRLIMRQLSQDTMSKAQTEEGRVEVLPVQWRKHLNLEVDAIAAALMPSGVRGLRSMFHATAVEVLLYLTPVHCQDMLDSLTTSINATFTSFMKRNPAFQGKVSILAHSLGSVLCYEILCNQPHLFDHLEFNMHGTPAPSDPSDPSRLADTLYNTHHSTEGRQQQQQQQPTQKRQASTEIGFAPLNSTDLDDSYQAASSCPTFPALGALKLPPKSVPGLGIAPGWKAKAEAPGLQAENDRLRLELEAVRADRDRLLSSQQASTSGQTAFGWQPPALPPSKQQQETTGEGGLLPPHMDIKPLLFPVDNFICIGSPLGLFLALRGVDPSKGRALGTPPAGPSPPSPSPTSTADGLPAANRIYNLYQPYDPVAYRMEPLIVAGGEKRKPVFAPYYKGGRRLHIGMAEFAEDFGGSVSKAALGSVSVMKMAAGYLGKAVVASKVEKKMDQAGRALDREDPAAVVEEEGLDAEEGTPADEADVELKSNASESAIWRLTAGKGDMGLEGAGPLRMSGSMGSGEWSGGVKAREPTSERRTAAGRIDFVLQDSPTENAYVATIKAHFRYWSSYDTALFVLRAVYGIDVLQEGRYASKIKPVKDVIAEKASISDVQEQPLPV